MSKNNSSIRNLYYLLKRRAYQVKGTYPLTRLSKNKNSDNSKTYYVIRRPGSRGGFFSNYLYVLGHVAYADKKGYIPVVDMLNYKTVYNELEDINGTENAWEYYFLQPNDEDLSAAYESGNCILSDGLYLSQYTLQYVGKGSSLPSVNRIRELSSLTDRYMKVRPEILDSVNAYWNMFVLDNDHTVLGVHVRGTDMKACKGHPVPRSVDDYVSTIRDMINRHDTINNIFLCTDEKGVIDRFCLEFPGKVFFTDSYRADSGSTTGIHMEKESPRQFHHYLLGREVLEDVILLSKCNYLLCGHSNVSLAALIMNAGAYLDVKCLD